MRGAEAVEGQLVCGGDGIGVSGDGGCGGDEEGHGEEESWEKLVHNCG